MSTQAREARDTASTGANAYIGMPPTPMPTFMWTGMRAAVHAGLDERQGAGAVPGHRLARHGVDRRAEDGRPGLLYDGELAGRLEPRQARALVLEQRVGAEHDLGRHADHDAHLRVSGTQDLDGPQRRQKVGVAGGAGGVEVDAVGAGVPQALGDEDHVVDGQLDGLLLGGARLVDLHLRQQLRPVAAGTVGRRVAAQVGLGAVVHRHREAFLRLLHELLLEGHDGLHGLVRVVDVKELDSVVRQHLLAGIQRVDAAAELRRAAAVLGEHDLVADVDAGEARRRGEDVEQMVEFVGGEGRHLAPARRRLRALLELGLDLAAGRFDQRAVAHAGQYLRFHQRHLRGFAAPGVGTAPSQEAQSARADRSVSSTNSCRCPRCYRSVEAGGK